MDRGSQTLNVLVVDDYVDTRERLCALLREQEAVDAVGCAATLDDVTTHLESTLPRVVAIDVPTHDPSGFTLVETIRRLCNTTLVVLTNFPSEEFTARSRAAGADYVLNKSTEFERVIDITRAFRSV